MKEYDNGIISSRVYDAGYQARVAEEARKQTPHAFTDASVIATVNIGKPNGWSKLVVIFADGTREIIYGPDRRK